MNAGLRCLLLAGLLALTGCSTSVLKRVPPEPGRTSFGSPLVMLPAQRIGHFLVIETKWDRHGPYRFLVDTGSSVSLISPALARRYPGWGAANPGPRVRVAGADGTVLELAPTSVRRIELGEAQFDDVPVLIYDCAALSAHLGVRIDGVLGFPLFRETVLTLDYPGSRVILQPAKTEARVPGSIVKFDGARKTPVIPVQLGDRTLLALIDSGSDATFSLNPVGLNPEFAFGPVAGGVVGTLAGDSPQQTGRLAATLAVGDYRLPQPIVDLSDTLSAIGAGLLRHFTVTFDQANDRVAFLRDSREPIATPARRSAGVSFTKTPAYWRIAGVVPGSPAAAAGVQTGDLVTRIDGEPVAKWDLNRYEALLAQAGAVTLSFLLGTAETEKRVRIFDLVP